MARWLLNIAVCSLPALLAACSNGRGSVDEPASGQSQSGFSVGGSVSGLAGGGLVLQNNGGDPLSIAANGAFTFPTLLANDAAYAVSVRTQPPGGAQSCTVANGSGRIPNGNVANITVTCASGSAFFVRGSVSGLEGSGLTLRNNGGDDLPVNANGAFAFNTPLSSGSRYAVTIAAQPANPSQSCVVSNGSGTIGSADVSNVSVACTTGRLTVGGTVAGLTGSGLVLQINGEGDLAINANGPFTFPDRFASGASYTVTTRSHPSAPNQTCTIRNASGVLGNANVTNVAVVCASDAYAIGGSISGLVGRGLTLRLNGGNNLEIFGNGAFAFERALENGATYNVTVARQPDNPAQRCTVANGAGAVSGANVSNIAIECATTSHRVGGSVSGLTGSGLLIQLNGQEQLTIASNGSFTFDAPLPSGTTYRVEIVRQPDNPVQRCTLANANGVIGSADVRSVRIACASGAFSVGGSVSGLQGAGLELINNGEDILEIDGNGAFTFNEPLATGARYEVSVRRQPSDPDQRCSVSNGNGVVGAANIDNIRVRCDTNDYTIGGSVGGLVGTGLILQNNGADALTIDSDGGFRFSEAVPNGASYNVTVAAQPRNPDQVCSVRNGAGQVSGSNVTNVRVECEGVREEFRIGGRVSDLSGSGLVLRNNGGDDLPIASNGRFRFSQTLPSGASYNVTVASQPSDQTCTVNDGSGVVGDSDVRDIDVECDEEDDDDDDDDD